MAASKLAAKAPAKKTPAPAPEGKPAKAERKPIKLPKSLGACVDLYHKTREARLAAGRVSDDIKKDETFIANHIIDNVPKGDKGAIGTNYKGVVKTEETFQIEDWLAFYAWIKKNDAFDVLNRAINQAALADRTDVLNEKLDLANKKLPTNDPKRKPRKMLPGVRTFKVVKLSVTKV